MSKTKLDAEHDFISQTFSSYCEMLEADVAQTVRVDGVTARVPVPVRKIFDILSDAKSNGEVIEFTVWVDSFSAKVFFDFSQGVNCMSVGNDLNGIASHLKNYIRAVLQYARHLSEDRTPPDRIESHGTYKEN